MILHEFICQDCRQEFEELIKQSDGDTVVCPKCRSTNVKRVLSAVKSRSGAAGRESAADAAGCAPGGFS